MLAGPRAMTMPATMATRPRRHRLDQHRRGMNRSPPTVRSRRVDPPIHPLNDRERGLVPLVGRSLDDIGWGYAKRMFLHVLFLARHIPVPSIACEALEI